METKTTDLASRLLSIPSYVSATCDERALGDFIVEYVRNNLPAFRIERSLVDDSGRANIYLLGKKSPRLVFVGHIDTVQPSDGWDGDPLVPTLRNGRLYGLGAADMKGSIASLLQALQNSDPVLLDEIAVLLYVDEEYRFAGMKQLLKDEILRQDTQPELVVSLDGSLEVLSGCRGLIKIDIEVTGKSGHASNPANGINAITGCMEVMRALENTLPAYTSELGDSTMNVARFSGGAVTDIANPSDMQRSGNVIPNYAECIVELRTASPKLNAKKVEEIIRAECSSRKLRVESLNIKIDLGVWPGSNESAMIGFLKRCYSEAGMNFIQADPQFIGFIDVQMLAETIASPIYVIGAGGENKHGANENVAISDLEKARTLYQLIITNLIGEK